MLVDAIQPPNPVQVLQAARFVRFGLAGGGVPVAVKALILHDFEQHLKCTTRDARTNRDQIMRCPDCQERDELPRLSQI